jgi:myeloid leukemia factor 1
MFGFPTDLFGNPNSNNRGTNSNALIPHQQSLFGNSLMMPSPFGVMNSLLGDFGMNSSPFAMMDRMMHQANHTSNAPVHSFTSTTVMSFNGTDGRPKVYQETTSRNRGPGGIEETRQAIRDSERGINKVNRVQMIAGASP